jgi:hypothetical protein
MTPPTRPITSRTRSLPTTIEGSGRLCPA